MHWGGRHPAACREWGQELRQALRLALLHGVQPLLFLARLVLLEEQVARALEDLRLRAVLVRAADLAAGRAVLLLLAEEEREVRAEATARRLEALRRVLVFAIFSSPYART